MMLEQDLNDVEDDALSDEELYEIECEKADEYNDENWEYDNE